MGLQSMIGDMSGMSSGSIGSSSAANYNETDSRNAEVGIDGDGQAYGFGDNSNVNVTDGGAIASMGTVAMQSLANETDSQKLAFEFAKQASASASSQSDKSLSAALKFAYEAGRPEADTWNKTTTTAAILFGLLAVAWMVMHK